MAKSKSINVASFRKKATKKRKGIHSKNNKPEKIYRGQGR